MKKIGNSNKELVDNVSYTYYGYHDYLDGEGYPVLCDNADKAEDRDTAFAKIMSNRYFVKSNARGNLYNPMGTYDEKTHLSMRFGTGRKTWEWKEVHLRAFTLYLNFLKTKNIAYLLNAERESV